MENKDLTQNRNSRPQLFPANFGLDIPVLSVKEKDTEILGLDEGIKDDDEANILFENLDQMLDLNGKQIITVPCEETWCTRF